MHIYTLVLGYSFFAYPTATVAVGTVENESTVGFIQGDNQRDTISLLISCLVTLGLCVYSAVHLNVPAKGERHFQTLGRELKWCIIGLFAPELVLYTAWRQFASAKELCEEVSRAQSIGQAPLAEGQKEQSEHIGECSLPQSLKRNHHWTISHGFYGTMGGIAIDLDSMDSAYSPFFGGAKRLTLTAKGVALLAHCGHLPDISADDIKDKNKADSLAKVLVCFQAGWMIIQVICRQGLGLPSSLLEVHTVAHVVCALLMYAIWWHKPRQVASPTVLRAESVLPLVAYMYSASRISGEKPRGIFGKFLNPRPVLKQMIYLAGHEETSDRTRQLNSGDQQHDIIQASTFDQFVPLPPGPTSNHNQERELGFPDDHATTTRRKLAAKAVPIYPAIRSRFQTPEGDLRDMLDPVSNAEYLVPYAAELVQLHPLNWPNAGLLRRTQSLVMGMTLWGASMAYGAIHVSAWHYFFPTYAEQLLWRLSSVWITFCAAFWLIVHLLAFFFPMIDRVWIAYNERRLGLLGTGVITLLCVLCGVSFVGSRAFLVVEAFVSIRVVPRGVYETPIWAQVFPHL